MTDGLSTDRIVRRYMDLSKYLDLIRSKTIYLCRADEFGDRFEGALTPAFRSALNDANAEGKIDYDADCFYHRDNV